MHLSDEHPTVVYGRGEGEIHVLRNKAPHAHGLCLLRSR